MTNDDRQSKMKALCGNSKSTRSGMSLALGLGMSDVALEQELSRLRGEYRRQLKAASWDGALWVRSLGSVQEADQEGIFSRMHCALDNGTLFFYRSRDELLHFSSTLPGEHSVRLLDYELESSARRVAGLDKQGLSISKSVRSVVFGTHELSFTDMLGAGFDVNSAASAYKFCLIPKVSEGLTDCNQSISFTMHRHIILFCCILFCSSRSKPRS
jgi:hypothetical protein